MQSINFELFHLNLVATLLFLGLIDQGDFLTLPYHLLDKFKCPLPSFSSKFVLFPSALIFIIIFEVKLTVFFLIKFIFSFFRIICHFFTFQFFLSISFSLVFKFTFVALMIILQPSFYEFLIIYLKYIHLYHECIFI